MSSSTCDGRRRGRLARPTRGLAWLALVLMLAVLPAGASEPAAIDLNRASVSELEALPGIGAAKAAAIVEHRESSGAFRSIDELESVRGIGPALVEKLRPFVTLGPKAPTSSRPERVAGP